MPRKSLQGRTCGVSCEGGRARTLQPSRRPHASRRCRCLGFCPQDPMHPVSSSAPWPDLPPDALGIRAQGVSNNRLLRWSSLGETTPTRAAARR
ncbi:hypothetical protein XarbCFBP7610_17400 [Xanthomonas arboricola]|nr:hypothetical protein XarbCFBP7610_17400 [Xanthomonas arboricola]